MHKPHSAFPANIHIRCHRPAAKPAQTSRSKSSSKSKFSLSELVRSPTRCDTERESTYLAAVYSLLCRLIPHLPPLEDASSSSQVFEEVQAGFLMLRKITESRETQARERQSQLQAALDREHLQRLELEHQLQDLSSMEELKVTKAIIINEEEDLQRKINYVEQKMNETLALKDAFERSYCERDEELSRREAKLRLEEAKVAMKAKELAMKEKVLVAFEHNLEEGRTSLELAREEFREAKCRWALCHPSPELVERSQMSVEDCRSQLHEVNDLYAHIMASKRKVECEAESLKKDRCYLEDTTQMLEALHEEILQDRQDVAEDVKMIKSEWDFIRNEKVRLREAWQVLKLKKDDPHSDPSTEESPMKLPEYRTPNDSWGSGFMSLHPISFSESPVPLRKA